MLVLVVLMKAVERGAAKEATKLARKLRNKKREQEEDEDEDGEQESQGGGRAPLPTEEEVVGLEPIPKEEKEKEGEEDEDEEEEGEDNGEEEVVAWEKEKSGAAAGVRIWRQTFVFSATLTIPPSLKKRLGVRSSGNYGSQVDKSMMEKLME